MGVIGNILGLYRDNGKENGNYYNVKTIGLFRGYIGDYIGIMEKKMETTIVYCRIYWTWAPCWI